MSKQQEPRRESAEAKLKRWGSCTNQGELFARKELSTAKPVKKNR